MNDFLNDVLKGLQSSPKYLDSKYFYDKKGDALFQKIMDSDEYYLTKAEMEIFSKQTAEIVNKVLPGAEELDVIEFGPGDAVKSIFLLKELYKRKAIAAYFPIDISKNIIDFLSKNLPNQIPGLPVKGFAGEYLKMLSEVNKISANKKLVLFLGANIGNFKFNKMAEFCTGLRNLLSAGDMVLIGFDLKKNPKKILAAYNDAKGFTKEFNLNLLQRINKELDANFELKNFDHYAMYNPESGACKSFLISLKKQQVLVEGHLIDFEKNEFIFMEVSQKYLAGQTDEIAGQCGFTPVAHFFDTKKYFMDTVWKMEA